MLDFSDVVPAVTSYFEMRYPAMTPNLLSNYSEKVGPNFWENMHNKRCVSIENYQAIEDFFSLRWSTLLGGNSVLISTPCLGSDSLGNRLAAYFENVICANKVGMHYLSVSKVWEPRTSHAPSDFINSLPTAIQHSNPLSKKELKTLLKEKCRCKGSCHERLNAVWCVRTLFSHLLNPVR